MKASPDLEPLLCGGSWREAITRALGNRLEYIRVSLHVCKDKSKDPLYLLHEQELSNYCDNCLHCPCNLLMPKTAAYFRCY